jgi:hypothetical protein
MKTIKTPNDNSEEALRRVRGLSSPPKAPPQHAPRHIPNSAVRTSYTMVIRVGGISIGMIQQWAPSQGRSITPYYEVNSVGGGNVSENIPGISSGLSINIVRHDLYKKQMEQAWGRDFDITMLTDQTNPLTVVEKWYDPSMKVSDIEPDISDNFADNIRNAEKAFNKAFSDLGDSLKNPSAFRTPKIGRTYIYEGFWFTSLGRVISATDSRIVSANATAMYSRVYRAN